MSQAEHKEPPAFYKDIAVIAYKLPETDKYLSELNVVVTSSGGSFSLLQLTDGDVSVTNLWVNRLIGDQQPGATNKITYTTMPFYNAGSPLLPSGLLGPVHIVSVSKNDDQVKAD